MCTLLYVVCTSWKMVKNEKWIFHKRISILAKQMNEMISGDSNNVNNRRVWFGSIISLGKSSNGYYTFVAFS